MSKTKGTKTIAKVAKQNGVSEQEVRKEIQIAIDMAMANPDPAIQAHWAKVPCKGDKPTPEDAILFLAGQVKKDL